VELEAPRQLDVGIAYAQRKSGLRLRRNEKLIFENKSSNNQIEKKT